MFNQTVERNNRIQLIIIKQNEISFQLVYIYMTCICVCCCWFCTKEAEEAEEIQIGYDESVIHLLSVHFIAVQSIND